MITRNLTNRGKGCLSSRGFSLVELMVVVAILGILAAAVGMYVNTAGTKLRSFAFNLGSRFKQAKFEAIKRGLDVYIDFDRNPDDDLVDNGFTMWVDVDGNETYNPWVDGNANGLCDEGEGDCLVGEAVVFPNQASTGKQGPEIYNLLAAPIPTGGPDTGPKGAAVGDGVSAGHPLSPRFRFRPSGDSSAGSVYIYFPRAAGGGKVVAAGPFAIIVSNTGRITLSEYKGGWK